MHRPSNDQAVDVDGTIYSITPALMLLAIILARAAHGCWSCQAV
jgi:hypothetical protein